MLEDHLYGYLKFYKKAPITLKILAGMLYREIPKSIRYGNQFRIHQLILSESKSWSQEEIEAFQLDRINKLVAIAFEETAYYRNLYQGMNRSFSSLSDFRLSIPLVSKSELRSKGNEFLNQRIKKKRIFAFTTGGTTGEPLKLFFEKGVSRVKELVYMNDQWRRIGYREGDSLAVFRSVMIRGRESNRLWDYDPIKKRHYFSTYDLNKTTIALYLDMLRKIKPKYLHVYPSVLTIIASFMLENRIEPISSIKGILSGSENTMPNQIKLFENVFKCKVFRWYGLGEMSSLAGSCEYCHDYHAYPTYSYTELIDPSGKPVEKIGQVGEIVGTTFDNIVMPLVRYRTGDFAVYGGQSCAMCGRKGLMLKEIEGRAQEFIMDAHGNVLSLGPFLFSIHEEMFANISAIQFIQEEKGKLDIYAISMNLSPDQIKNYLHSIFEPRFSGNFEIKVYPVERIERTALGKHRYVIQRLNVDGYLKAVNTKP